MTSPTASPAPAADQRAAQPPDAAARGSPGGLEIAVIIVTYKSAALTVACLRSIQGELANPDLRVRAIVVDNASGDLPTIARAVEHEGWSDWVTLLLSPRNGGFAYGNNRGIERAYASGNPAYFLLLNPDTQVRPGAIGNLVRFLEQHPECGIAGSGIENFDGSDWPIAFRFPTLMSEFHQGLNFGLLARLLGDRPVVMNMSGADEQVDWISGSSMMIRPTVFRSIGGMDENYFLYFEETDFCRRARNAGFTTWYVPASRVMHIGGQSTKVTDLTDGLKRLPAYWFASRRRYFAVTFGVGHAIALDIVSLFAYSLGWLKRIALGRRDTVVPYFIRDLFRNSIIWPGNRNFASVKCDLSANPAAPAAAASYAADGGVQSPQT
jgi:N-acetylglucosaminyl-diphospho-decaprenol L-rhamnosyltransferase